MILWDFYIQGEGSEEDLGKQFDETFKIIDDLEFRNMLSGEEDRLSAICLLYTSPSPRDS